jgi:hypothetical protein
MAKCEICKKDIAFWDDSGIMNGLKSCRACTRQNLINIMGPDVFKKTSVGQKGLIVSEKTRKAFPLFGCILALIALFIPILNVPNIPIPGLNFSLSSITIFSHGPAFYIIAITILSAITVYLNKYGYLGLTGFAMFGGMFYSLIKFQTLFTTQNEVTSKLGMETVKLINSTVSISWLPMAVLLLGILMIVISMDLKSSSAK